MYKLIAEALGTSFITMAVIGSGIMATNLTEDVAIQLLVNCVATVAVLYLSITVFSTISGSHFNPMVSIFSLSKKNLGLMTGYIATQIAGATLGALSANVMFQQPAFEFSTTIREGSHLLVGEFIASAGLLFIVFFKAKNVKSIRPALISFWILGAYFFTSSTSFANPAVTFGRMLSDSFAGIAPSSALIFVAIQIIGSSAGYSLALAMRRK
ncbi:MAG: aquaporin [Candidatus Nanopelagicales bacterium]